MSTWYVVCTSTAVCLAILSVVFQLHNKDERKNFLQLGVCILTARENQKHRATIRTTWMRDAPTSFHQKNRTLVKFVVGNGECPIPPEDRVDHYSCQEWIPTITNAKDLSQDFEAFVMSSTVVEGLAVKHLYIKILHPITLKRIGIKENLNLSQTSLLVVTYRNFDEEALAESHFSRTDPGITHKGFRYQPIEAAKLQKGTELELILTEADVDSSVRETNKTSAVHEASSEDYATYTGPGIIQNPQAPGVVLIQSLHPDGTVLRLNGSQVQSLVSFMYSLDDVAGLLQHVQRADQRRREWRRLLADEDQAVLTEAAEHRDLLVVDVVDVYRALPVKLLHCHAWFARHFHVAHILKTDDDVFLDLARVIGILAATPLTGNTVWGKREWPVERMGKWREPDFPSSVYPSFPCGSGYVVSRDIHSWLADNVQRLHSFQGEDVSTGIWLAPLAPELHQVCSDSMLSMPDLTPAELTSRWSSKTFCSSPCQGC